MGRVSKINYYLDIAQTVASRSTCLRRRYGACIVKNDVIVSTGYCGAPRGRENCCDMGYCLRKKMQIPHGCQMCKRLIINAGIETVVYRETGTLYRVKSVGDWINEENLEVTGY
jgi:dCMP deaminase